MRQDRAADALRLLTIDTQFNRYAEGSALISKGVEALGEAQLAAVRAHA